MEYKSIPIAVGANRLRRISPEVEVRGVWIISFHTESGVSMHSMIETRQYFLITTQILIHFVYNACSKITRSNQKKKKGKFFFFYLSHM